jgi:hypothetical protein
MQASAGHKSHIIAGVDRRVDLDADLASRELRLRQIGEHQAVEAAELL